MSQIRIGTCGFGMRQAAYFDRFRLIEIQRTFYQPPQVSTAERWRDQAPEDFELTVKAFQAITHLPSSPTFRRSKLSDAEREECGAFRDTATVRHAWQQTLGIARALHASFVIFQCPARFKPADEHVNNLRQFFGWAERAGLRFGWEPRGNDWTAPLIKGLCRELERIHVVDPFVDRPLRGTPSYFRLHGPVRNGRNVYGEAYTGDELQALKEKCTAKRTCCLFNNRTMAGDAERFQRRVCG